MDEQALVNELLRHYLADRDRGELRTVADYQRIFPGHDLVIERELALLNDGDCDYRRSVHDAPDGSCIDGDRFGPYRLIRTLGRGGQGTVFLAEDTRLGRHIALKVLTGIHGLSHETVERFRREALIASRLEDPGICGVFEAGTLNQIPFIAMRFVEGESLASHIDAARNREGSKASTIELSGESEPDNIRLQRVIRLFESAARSLHNAHEAGVVHRDIKPANLMVTPAAHPVILDFGVARIQDETMVTLTQTGDLFGTPAYMSPEQVTAGRLDRRTDVFSLGVTLFECVTLKRPFEAATRDGLFSTIAHCDPPDPRQLNRALPPDLKIILDVALAKDVGRRYQTALDLAEDLKRLLNGDAILARPPTYTYQLRKLAHRHRAIVRAAAVVFLVLVAGIIATTYQAFVALAERDRAQNEASITTAVNDFLNTDLLASVDPELALGRNVTVREVLDTAAGTIQHRFATQPLVEAAIRLTIGNAYRSLGELIAAAPHLERAVELRQSLLGENDPSTLSATSYLGWLYLDQGHYADAQRVHLATLKARQSLLGSSHEDTLSSMFFLASVYQGQGRIAEADGLLTPLLDEARRTYGLLDRRTLQIMIGLADLREMQQRFNDAGELYEKAMRGLEETLGATHPRTLIATGGFARFLAGQGRYEESEVIYRDLLARFRVVHGPRYFNTLVAMQSLAALLFTMNRVKEAEEMHRDALDGLEAELGPAHPITLGCKMNLGMLLQSEGQYAEAEEHLTAVVETQRRLQPAAADTFRSMGRLASLYVTQSRYTEADELFREALAGMLETHGEQHEQTLLTKGAIAGLRWQQGKLDDSERLYREVVAGLRHVRGDIHPETLGVIDGLASVLFGRGQLADAEALFEEACDGARTSLPEGHRMMPIYLTHLGQCYLALKNYADAESSLLEAHDLITASDGDSDPLARSLMGDLAHLYDAWGKPDEAQAWRARK